MTLRFSRALRMATLLFACAAPALAQPLALIPTLSQRVNDNVAMLTPQEENALAQSLADLEGATGTQVVVLTVAATAPETVAEYAARLARAWAADHDGNENAVFVVVARDNRPAANRVRIEPGRRLPTPLAAADLQRIVDEEMLPRFALLDYAGALSAGTGRLTSLLRGQPLAPRVDAPTPIEAPPPPTSRWPEALAVVAVVALLLGAPLVRLRSRRLVYLTGHRALNRSFEPMVAGRFTGRAPKLAPEEGNGFGGHGVGTGFAGGGGDFAGGGATGFW